MAADPPKRGGSGVPIDVAALKTARESKGWSQKKLANEIGCEARVIERIESRGTAAIRTLADIAEVLGVDPQSLRPAPTTPPTVNRPLQLPAVVPDFIGHEDEIRDMVNRLRGIGAKIEISALRGMGGIGKTSLAVRVAHEVKGHFPDGQLFLDLRGTADGMKACPLTPTNALRYVIHRFHPAETDLPDDEQELAARYRGVLAGKRALIVLDNAGSEGQVRSLLTASPPVAFLITSRYALALDGVASIQVGLLPPDQAYLMLRGIVGARGTTDELRRIMELCGYLPLGIRVAGDFLRLKEDWPVSQYIVALERERLRWLKIGDDPAKNVEAVLKLSSAQLVRDSVDRATRWHILHVFQGDFDLAAAAAAWQADEKDLRVRDDLSDLKNRSLLLYDNDTSRYRLHDLMRPIAEGLFG